MFPRPRPWARGSATPPPPPPTFLLSRVEVRERDPAANIARLFLRCSDESGGRRPLCACATACLPTCPLSRPLQLSYVHTRRGNAGARMGRPLAAGEVLDSTRRLCARPVCLSLRRRGGTRGQDALKRQTKRSDTYRIERMAILAWVPWGMGRRGRSSSEGDRSDVDSVALRVHIYAPHICMYVPRRCGSAGAGAWVASCPSRDLDEVTSKQREIPAHV